MASFDLDLDLWWQKSAEIIGAARAAALADLQI